MTAKRTVTRIHCELLFALESARTLLAIAMAAETKTASRVQWHYYLETEDRVRRLMKKLRASGCDAHSQFKWNQALNALKPLSQHDRAQHLCQVLGRIALEFE